MRCVVLRALLVGAFVSVAPTPGVGQNQASSGGGGFGVGYTDIGPTIGLGGIGAAGMAIGGRFERGITTIESLGNGVLGFQVSADYYHYSDTFSGSDFDFTYIPIGATANYHFNVDNWRIDPFLGLGLGYANVSTDYGGSYGSGIYAIGRAGIRYFMSSGLVLYGDVGAGAATLNVGLMFRMAGRN